MYGGVRNLLVVLFNPEPWDIPISIYDPQFRTLDIEAAVVINTVTNSGLKFERKKKKIDMCQAVVDMRKEERQEGRYEGERKATARINRLNSMLIAARRFDDLKRASENVSYQEELMEELLRDEE